MPEQFVPPHDISYEANVGIEISDYFRKIAEDFEALMEYVETLLEERRAATTGREWPMKVIPTKPGEAVAVNGNPVDLEVLVDPHDLTRELYEALLVARRHQVPWSHDPTRAQAINALTRYEREIGRDA